MPLLAAVCRPSCDLPLVEPLSAIRWWMVGRIIDAAIWQNGGPAVALESLLPAGHGWGLHTAQAINNADGLSGTASAAT